MWPRQIQVRLLVWSDLLISAVLGQDTLSHQETRGHDGLVVECQLGMPTVPGPACSDPLRAQVQTRLISTIPCGK